jgi:aryl-alcohol dehydrogenase-like predicted oxidoreductase
MQQLPTIELGCGLIRIGREWGYKKSTIPQEQEALDFVQYAYTSGIRYFDTAPSYGTSEARLGKFLQTLSDTQRKQITIATKFGEHWDSKKQAAFVDQSDIALISSLEKSLELLGTINVLYLHKTNPEILKSKNLMKGFDYARSRGITKFGASVSDIESAIIVCQSNIFSVIQFPYNTNNSKFGEIIDLAKKRNKTVVINRPFNMGENLYTETIKDPFEQKVDAYEFILREKFSGCILTGTTSPEHLKENLEAFMRAQKKLQNEKN